MHKLFDRLKLELTLEAKLEDSPLLKELFIGKPKDFFLRKQDIKKRDKYSRHSVYPLLRNLSEIYGIQTISVDTNKTIDITIYLLHETEEVFFEQLIEEFSCEGLVFAAICNDRIIDL